MIGFEPMTSYSQNRRATKLRYIPKGLKKPNLVKAILLSQNLVLYANKRLKEKLLCAFGWFQETNQKHTAHRT